MLNRTWTSHRWLAAIACACLLAGGAPDAQATITVGLTPATLSILPGADFDVSLDITSAGAPFNGFSVVLSYDPTILTLLPTSPSILQEGCLMTGGCSAACGTTFHQFAASGDSIVVNDYLFCNLVSLAGPGQLYRLRFHAANNARTTQISIRRATFYNTGLLATPVNAAGTTIQVPANLAVGDGSRDGTSFRVEPNPAFGRLQLVLEDQAGGLVQADIMDVQGRVVRRLGPTWLGARARLEWDGSDASGNRSPGGLYLARIQRSGRVQTSRFVLIR
jgi:hypothetical protein